MSEPTDQAANEPVVEQTATTTESAPVEAQASEVTDFSWDDDTSTPTEAPKTETESTEAPAQESAEDKPADETEVDDQSQSEEKPLAEKSVKRFQKLANENRQLREEKAQLEGMINQIYGVQTPEELVENGETEAMAAVKSMQQERELEKYTQQVAEGRTYVAQESMNVLNDFPMFNPDNQESYKPELAQKAARLVEPLLIRDSNVPEIGPDGQPTGKGLVIGARSSLYEIYETLAQATQSERVEGQIAAQRATEKMLANADSVGNAAPPKTKTDPLIDLWKD